MNPKDLRERASTDLQALQASLKKDLFDYRMKNFTNQLENTSLIKATRKDLARIHLILHERANDEQKTISQGATS